MSIDNFGYPQVAGRAFLVLAAEAGLETRIKKLLTRTAYAIDKLTLAQTLAQELADDGYAQLAASINVATMDRIIEEMADDGLSPIYQVMNLPGLVNAAGPASVTASRNGDTITGTYTQHAGEAGGDVVAELYLDETYIKDISGGTFSQNTGGEAITTVRVLYRQTSSGRLSRFGPVVTL